MEEKTSGNFKTPKMNSVRTLGLRRKRIGATPSSAPLPKIVMDSDEKVDYGRLTPATPVSSNTTPVEGKASTTGNCRPYRLALSKRMRDRLTKKRLDFHMPRDEHQDHSSSKVANADLKVDVDKSTKTNTEEANDTTKSVENATSTNTQEETREQLIAAIKIAQARQHARLQHNKKVAELKSAIDKWKSAFGQAMQELKELIGPPVDNALILEQLRIPQSMLNYLED